MLAGAALAVAGAPGAHAGSGGIHPTVGGKVTGFECRTDCPGIDVVGSGSVVRIRGENLGSAGQVIFLGGRGTADNATAAVQRVREDEVDVRVPAGARSGPVTVVNTDGAMSEPSGDGLAIYRAGDTHGLASSSIDAKIESRTVFYAGRRKARFTYLVKGANPIPVRVDLVRIVDGALVGRWAPQVVAPGTPQSVTWNGLHDGKLEREGRYEFRLFSGAAATAAGAARVAEAPPDPAAADSFQFLGHIFPIRGRHTYGTEINHFGGGRGHKGEDVLAGCGTPLAAARGGKVLKVGYDGYGGGNYVAIDGERIGLDYVYMHLRDPALVKEGDRVWTGQLIGFVGDTGNASTCHLHFELWRGGFWNGGAPFDPLPSLRAWDRLS